MFCEEMFPQHHSSGLTWDVVSPEGHLVFSAAWILPTMAINPLAR
jgi:hypothetical protein